MKLDWCYIKAQNAAGEFIWKSGTNGIDNVIMGVSLVYWNRVRTNVDTATGPTKTNVVLALLGLQVDDNNTITF